MAGDHFNLEEIMDILLHIGAHRTGTSSLQMGIGKNRQMLKKMGITYWGPSMIRKGLFAGMFRPPNTLDGDENVKIANQSKSNINSKIQNLSERGQTKLLISEENIMGSMKTNLREAELYPNLFMRLAHFSSLFGSNCAKIGISLRAYDEYWASSIAFSITHGYHFPSKDELTRLVNQTRSWRDIVVEVSEVFPNAKILVWDFNSLAGKNEEIVKLLTGVKLESEFLPLDNVRHNASPRLSKLKEILMDRGDFITANKIPDHNSTYQPFTAVQIDHLKSKFQADLDWLKDGADGVAHFIRDEKDINNLLLLGSS